MPIRQTEEERRLSDDEETSPDLGREAANMLELLSRQSESSTLLNISSKAAQAVIKQF